MNTTSPTLRFARTTARGGALPLVDPLPPTLAALEDVVPFVEEHGRFVARLEELRAQLIEASVHLEKVKEEDVRKLEEAARAGKPYRAREGGSTEKVVERAQENLRSFSETVVPNNADKLLTDAAPFVGQALERVEDEAERGLDRAGELVAALDSELERVQGLADEASWLEEVRSAARIVSLNGVSVEPFQSLGGDQRVWQLRGAIRGAFEGFLQWRADDAAERARQKAWEDENRPGWERRAQEAAAQQEAGRAVYEGMTLVERGGKPVRKGAFGYEPVEGDEA
jgi:hypothetical protein